MQHICGIDLISLEQINRLAPHSEDSQSCVVPYSPPGNTMQWRTDTDALLLTLQFAVEQRVRSSRAACPATPGPVIFIKGGQCQSSTTPQKTIRYLCPLRTRPMASCSPVRAYCECSHSLELLSSSTSPPAPVSKALLEPPVYAGLVYVRDRVVTIGLELCAEL